MNYEKLFEEIYFEHRLKPLFEQVLREMENLPAITIEVNTEENYYFNAIQTAKTDDEKNASIRTLKTYYKTFFTQNYENKSATNDSNKIKVELVNSGIKHCLSQKNNYYLWPAIRYLPSIIKVAFYKSEKSQHIDKLNTTRGDIAHIFYCKGDYIFKSGAAEKKETHVLRIVAVTFKKGEQNNFRHLTKYTENKNIINTKLISIEIQ